MSTPPAQQHARIQGVIEPGVLYTVDEARARLRFGVWAWRKLVRAGLPVIKTSGRAFVLADDLIDFLAKFKPPGGPRPGP